MQLIYKENLDMIVKNLKDYLEELIKDIQEKCG